MSLKRNEWPSRIIRDMSDEILNLAIHMRTITGCSMVPSPDPEAHVRYTNGSSLHCIGTSGSKRSLATDVFLRNEQVSKFILTAPTTPGLGGLGIYFDTRLSGAKRVLVHMDIRENHMLWVCPSRSKGQKREYIYQHKDSERYYKILSQELGKL